MEKYLTLDNLEVALKFTGIFTTGIFAGGAIYIGESQLPGILAMTDMDQALMNFRYFWPRVKQMVSQFYLQKTQGYTNSGLAGFRRHFFGETFQAG